ncbi:hypothetical protein COV11_03725 [Candidatus Woesearchaeota archaeon CG10_big_fil_rev_8_21_14_0_10_30_7]|nr:MAG: hypothetical protein COV11_03725 [Candidatus Woesearchaeota archaeon CG10_big_fil_rev_8_21_14_0_10_30_7]
MSKLIYCATPSRLVYKIDKIMDFVTNQGNAPLHPFQAFPYERYEGNPRVGRTKSMEWCLRLVDICDEFYMFGVSNGTLEEVAYAIKTIKPVTLQFDGFDLEWDKFYQEIGQKYGNPLYKLLNKCE